MHIRIFKDLWKYTKSEDNDKDSGSYYRLFLDKIKRCDANSLGITSELVEAS